MGVTGKACGTVGGNATASRCARWLAAAADAIPRSRISSVRSVLLVHITAVVVST
ncbi:Uncharacterised protein [Mycobacteroides abscessus subsp. abscessus]|nr:Uncharacterised protein [Mycobacteroides abscessus subsp. abscessus]